MTLVVDSPIFNWRFACQGDNTEDVVGTKEILNVGTDLITSMLFRRRVIIPHLKMAHFWVLAWSSKTSEVMSIVIVR